MTIKGYIWPVILVLMVLLLSVFLSKIKHTMVVHELSLALFTYRSNHNGVMPSTLTDLALFMDGNCDKGVSSRKRKAWSNFAYVSGVTTNDPPTTLVLIDVPNRLLWRKGLVVNLGRGAFWTKNADLKRYLNEPWSHNSVDFRDAAALEDFKKRVKVVKP